MPCSIARGFRANRRIDQRGEADRDQVADSDSLDPITPSMIFTRAGADPVVS